MTDRLDRLEALTETLAGDMREMAQGQTQLQAQLLAFTKLTTRAIERIDRSIERIDKSIEHLDQASVRHGSEIVALNRWMQDHETKQHGDTSTDS